MAWTNPADPDDNADNADNDGNGIVDDTHGADFVGDLSNTPVVDGDPTDDDYTFGGHGAHVAGTIGGEGDNGVGITGVAQNVRLMPLRVCSRNTAVTPEASLCTTSAQINAINYAGAHDDQRRGRCRGGREQRRGLRADRRAVARHDLPLPAGGLSSPLGTSAGGDRTFRTSAETGVSATAAQAALGSALNSACMRSRLRVLLRRTACSHAFSAPGAGVYTERWTVGSVVVASVTRTVAGSGRVTVAVRYNARGRRLLQRVRTSTRVGMSASFADALRKTTTVTRTVTLRR